MNKPRFSFRNNPVLALTNSHWLAQVGLGLALTAMVSWVFLIPTGFGQDNPYIGTVVFVAIPLVLLAGVVLTPLGLWLGRRKQEVQLAVSDADRRVGMRRLAGFIGISALINLAIGTQVTYRSVHHMESREFCGSCHVMTPESRAFESGSHASLKCVDCHVADGAAGWIESKRQGTRQLYEVLTETVPVPIPSGIESGHMVAAAKTCEQCHWKEKLGATRLRVITKFLDDAENTPATTVLTMHVGGMSMGGIHGAHNQPGVTMRFVAADARRQTIPWVEYSNANTGAHRVYVRDGAKPEEYAEKPQITMQCLDCHNRPAHTFELADRAVDRALALGRISTSLPFVQWKGVELLQAKYETSAEAAERIPAGLREFYQSAHTELAAQRMHDVAKGGQALADIYSRNVFPELSVTWGTYPNNIGHEDSPGCFRCHDGEHKTATGEVLTNNCFRCHAASAMDETDPEILQLLGLEKPLKDMRKQ